MLPPFPFFSDSYAHHFNIVSLFIDLNNEAEQKRKTRERTGPFLVEKKAGEYLWVHLIYSPVFQYHPDEICLLYVDRVMAYATDIQIVRKIYPKHFKFERNYDFQPYLKYLAMLFLVVFVIGGTIFTTLVVHTLIIITTRGDRKFSLSRASLNSSFTHRNAILSLFMQVIWRQTSYGDPMKLI